MIKFLAVFTMPALLAAAATYTGVITDSMCVKDHKAMNLGADANCARQCVKADSKVKYVLFDGKKSYKLSDQQTPEKFAAQRVKITGKLFQKTGVISVGKIEAVR